MKHYLISHSMRLFFLVASVVLWLGIGLTGFANVHWLLYVPAVFFVFATVTGICPGLILSQLLLKKKASEAESDK